MTEFTPISALIGGGLIGLAAVTLMAGIGRIAGIAGIAGGMAAPDGSGRGWRVAFLAGLIVVPALAVLLRPDLGLSDFFIPLPVVAMAGFLVGIGTTIGSGCTSGHGVCGMARLSRRSVAATLTFMAAGVATVFVVRHLLGGLA